MRWWEGGAGREATGGNRRERDGDREATGGNRKKRGFGREATGGNRREGDGGVGGGRVATGGKQYVTKNICLDIRKLHGPHLTMIIPDICYILPTRIHMFYIYRTLKCYIFIIHST